MRFFILYLLLSVHFIYGTTTGIEILKNGTFKNDSSWYLALNGDASAKHTFENNMLSVVITSEGSESWFIQLTQNKVNIKQDRIYVFSFDIKSSQSRTILTSVCKDGGDYIPYSIRDTVKVDTSFSRYSQEFQMMQPTDSNARVEFNFGRFKGNIQLKNVSLVEYFEPKITFTGISPQNVAYSDEPVKLSWTSVGIRDTLKLSVSYDNGFSWSVINSNLKAVDSLEWVPGNTVSPWCFFKLSTSKIAEISTTPLQIIPKIDLISNGSFRNSYTGWVLTADTLNVQSTMSVQNSILALSSTGKGAVKLSQSSIRLNKDDLYELCFTCYSKPSCQMEIRLSECIIGTNPPQESSVKIVLIDDTPTRFSIQFKAIKTVTDGELQFFMDLAASEIFFSRISLVNITIPSAVRSHARTPTHNINREQFRSVFLSGKAQLSLPTAKNYEYLNLSGRKISGKQIATTNNSFRGSGVVIVVPRNGDRTEKFDNN